MFLKKERNKGGESGLMDRQMYIEMDIRQIKSYAGRQMDTYTDKQDITRCWKYKNMNTYRTEDVRT